MCAIMKAAKIVSLNNHSHIICKLPLNTLTRDTLYFFDYDKVNLTSFTLPVIVWVRVQAEVLHR